MGSRTLLLPCVGKSSRFPGVRPKWMLTAPDGLLSIQKAALSVPEQSIGRIVCAIRADHEETYGASKVIRRAFSDAVEILVIERDTNGPAETVALMIDRAQVSGPFLVKDSDSFFEPANMPDGSFVAACDLRQSLGTSRVGAKSFVVLAPDGSILGISEKSVSSNFISVGLYGFADTAIFQEAYEIASRENSRKEIFVSHVIAHALRANKVFYPFFVSGLIDVGTLADWKLYSAAKRSLIVDIDGVVFHNQSEYFPPYWGDPVAPIQANIDHLLRLQKAGAQIIFLTSRPEKYRNATFDALSAAGFSVHALVMGCAHSARVLINDYAASNPYPSALSVNLPRNAPDLPQLIEVSN